MTINLEALRAPFRPDEVSWRVGPTNRDKTNGIALAYVDARVVQDRLDDVCGLAGWQCRYSQAAEKTVCEIGIRVGDDWLWRADGAGDSDMEATKGALSDAFKRAAVRWGVGRYLYDIDSPWVEIEKKGNSYVIKDSEKSKLVRVLTAAAPAARPAAVGNPIPDKGTFFAEVQETIKTLSSREAIIGFLGSEPVRKTSAALDLTIGEREMIKGWANHRVDELKTSTAYTRGNSRFNGGAARAN